MKNKNLKEFYNKVYKKDERRHYSKNLFSEGLPLQASEALKEISWVGKSVLDIGCGTGLFTYLVKKAGAVKVVGIDYSKEAIHQARENYGKYGVEFYCRDFKKMKGKFDVVVSLGILEHMDNPLRSLKMFKSLIKNNGSIIVVSPNWTNPRGYILLALFYLFGVPITLADKHYLTPLEFKKWAKRLKMSLKFRTFDHDWAFGSKLIKDFKRRLPRVFPGNKNISKFIDWLDEHVGFAEEKNKFNGAIGLYHFR